MRHHRARSLLRSAARFAAVTLCSLGATLALFLVLPLMETIAQAPDTDLILQSVDTADVPPPPPPHEEIEEEESEPEPDAKPPELDESAPPLDLAQLELALNPGSGGDWGGADFAVKLNTFASTAKQQDDIDALFALADLDQAPRAVFQPSPIVDRELRKKTPATVYVLFVVDRQGRVENPLVQKSTDALFEKPALAAVKQWKFEPGKRNGEAVRFRMRVPITFPQG